jgi:RHS repeat-associated protein
LPSPLASASLNANNQLTQFGSSNLTYDANGNLTGDGTRTYTWDARNHLVSIGGAVSASFQYDPFGRRVSKTIGAATRNYLYDGVNPVQELSGGSPAANLLTGLSVDERFQRTDANGPANFLTDALGSTIALTGPAGDTIAQYTYGPYGNTTMTGSSLNPYQFTGRENDGTGLYYYRARYYDPASGRFISEDPIRFGGTQIDLYTYVSDNPVGFADPAGTCPQYDSVTKWHMECMNQPTPEEKCRCHCVYAAENSGCFESCMECFSSKNPFKPHELCICMCKHAKVEDWSYRSCDSLCKDTK